MTLERTKEKPVQKIRSYVGFLVLVLWGLSLILPAARDTNAPFPVAFGYELAATGFLGVGMLQFGWFANPCIVASGITLLFGKRPHILIGVPAMLFVLQSLLLPWQRIPLEVCHSKNCNTFTFLIGFYVWFASGFITGLFTWNEDKVREWLPEEKN